MMRVDEEQNRLAGEGGVPVRETFLPFHRSKIGEEEIREVVDTLRSGWLTTGPKTKRFEKDFSRTIGVKYAIGLNSCTAGIHLALISAGVGPGHEVLVPSVSFPSVANMVIHLGAKPVFVDVERDTLNLDVAHVVENLNENTKAVIVVHFAGHPCDMDPLMQIAGEYNLEVIEDCAHALEAQYKGKRVGTFGDYASYSFYATKNMTTGEGGMLVTPHEDRLEKLRMLSLHGISRDAWKRYSPRGYQHWETLYPGFKYNMFDLQAAIGLHQIQQVDSWLQVRKHWTEMYDTAFEDLEPISPLARRDYASAAFHLYVIRLEIERLNTDRDRILDALEAENIGVGVHFRPVHLHPYYRSLVPQKSLPVSEWASERILSLPLYPAMCEEDVQDVIRALKKIVHHFQK